MRKVGILACVYCGMVLNAATLRIFAEAAGNPYEGIVERNVFSLRAPPSPVPAQPPAPPPPKITLNGILSLGKKRALLQVPGTPKPGQPPAVESYILGEGERDGDIEVLEIDEKAGTVKVNNHGTPQTLDFENNGVKLPTMPAGIPPVTLPTFQPAPGVLPGRLPVPANTNPTVLPRIPTRTMRLPPAAPPNAAPGQGVPNTPGVISPQTQNDLTPEERAALIEIQRLRDVQQRLQNQQTPQ